jgi:hypothetical protein
LNVHKIQNKHDTFPKASIFYLPGVAGEGKPDATSIAVAQLLRRAGILLE